MRPYAKILALLALPTEVGVAVLQPRAFLVVQVVDLLKYQSGFYCFLVLFSGFVDEGVAFFDHIRRYG